MFDRLDMSDQFEDTLNELNAEESLLDTSTPILNKASESNELLYSCDVDQLKGPERKDSDLAQGPSSFTDEML